MMMDELRNQSMLAADMAVSQRMTVREAVVSSYDPNHYSARVRLQPENVETGWLPVATMRAGNGWGVFLPPSVGDVVMVLFEQGSRDAGLVLGALFGDRFRPVNVPAGEFLIRHKAGSLLRFNNDGTVRLESQGALSSSAPSWTHTGPMTLAGNLTVSGTASVSGAVSSQVSVSAPAVDAATSLKVVGKEMATHKHTVGTSTSSEPL